uniref:NADH-ubiquinone oxidoreductase chain 2 n=1 Tax=Cryptorhamphus sp. TaxID=2931285 RepID=A0A8T9ZWW7_9HEMI|nr:NADH dehydrogenase subunit 2 [Cryptorhamphus sp.]
MFNYSKLLFLTMIFTSTIITISSMNWMGMWMGMEINLMSFIPYISKIKNMKSSQAMMIYFLVQSIGSAVLLFSIMMNPLIVISPITLNEFIMMGTSLGILIKLGAAPFHNWVPEIMATLTWMEMFILSTWQKVAPLYMLSMMNPNFLVSISVIMSTIIGAIGGLNFTSLRKIMAYSSINHMSWMLFMMMMNSAWYKYLMLYTLMMLMTCIYFNSTNSLFINQIPLKSPSMIEKYNLVSLLLSMGGLPPFLGFLPKWMAIQSAMNSKLIILVMIMIAMSMLTLFFYMRMISSLMTMYSTSNKWVEKKSNRMLMLSIALLNLSLPVASIISFL